MAANKEEFVSLKDIQTSTSAKMHGRVLRVSPMKDGKGAPYFEARLSDGEGQIRLVGFKRSQRDLLSEFEASSNSIVLENCQVKKARLSEDLEVLL